MNDSILRDINHAFDVAFEKSKRMEPPLEIVSPAELAHRQSEELISRARDLLWRASQPTGTSGAWAARVQRWLDDEKARRSCSTWEAAK